MILWLILGVAGIAAAVLMGKSASTDSGSVVDSSQPLGGVPLTLGTLPDVSPEYQGGSWSTEYDNLFLTISQKSGVPFALLKAHAIRESALKANAFLQEPTGKASYGLMQVLWWANSNRFAAWGYSDDDIGSGTLLYDPESNIDIASHIILDNWNRFKNLRDTINAYNTGVAESKRQAPHNYVNDVLSYYSKLVGRTVT